MRPTRRAFLLSTCAGGAFAASHFPSETKRFPDPATEFPLFRLTDPSHNSWLPSSASRFIARKTNFLLYCSDRAGKPGLYRLDLKSGETTEIAQGSSLDVDIRFAALSPDDRNCYWAGDGALWLGSPHAATKPRELYRTPDKWLHRNAAAVTDDGIGALWQEQNDKLHRLRYLSLTRAAAPLTVAESPEPITEVYPRPRRAGAMYRRGQELWLVSYDAQQNYKLRIAPFPFASPQWTADGRAILYLSRPQPPALTEIREFTPDTNEDKLVAKTTQFAAFGRNADASVFVGSSGSKASPYVMLLVRAVKRELTIAEHKSSDPSSSQPVFSPNSQRIFFESDRERKSCLYAMAVEKLVEETAEQ